MPHANALSEEGIQENNNILPPNVKGKCRGNLKFIISKIAWNSATFVRNSYSHKSNLNNVRKGNHFAIGSGISIQVIWWGQTQQDGAKIKIPLRGSKRNAYIDYEIVTNAVLFHKYLINCEPLEIHLTTTTSNLQIGTIFVSIPKELIGFCSKSRFRENKFVQQDIRCKIFNPKNIYIGDIYITFKMLFYEKVVLPTAKSVSEKDLFKNIWMNSNIHTEKTSLEAIAQEEINLENKEPLIKHLAYKTFKEGKENLFYRKFPKADNYSRCNLKSDISPKVIDYLSGRKMTPREEKIALDEIHRTSPIDNAVEEIVTERFKSKQSTFLSYLDSLRIDIKFLTLLPHGIKEVNICSLAMVTFTIECRISPNLMDSVKPRYDYDLIRFYSNNFSDKLQRIDFNKEALRTIQIVHNECGPNFVDEAYLMFTVWWRKYGESHSRCLGTGLFRFTSLFESGVIEQTKCLTIRSCVDKVHVADLIVKVALGAKGVHFMLNIPGEDTVSPMVLSSNVIDESLKIREMKPTRKRNYDRDAKSSSNNSANDQKEPNQSSMRIEKTNQETQTNASLNKSSQKENSDSSIDTVRSKTNEKFAFLQGLLHVGSLRNARALEENSGYFLVCHAFWKEDACSTNFAQNSSFNFLKIFPIINDQKFLDRVRNNHLSIELWQKSVHSSEIHIGTAKLPLHQFFIAFRDNVITNHLSHAKLPVISIDGWITVASPLAGDSCGQLECLLAIGTEVQLEYLKTIKGLNFSDDFASKTDSPGDIHIPVPKLPKYRNETNKNFSKSKCCDAESQTSEEKVENRMFSDQRERLTDLLGTFIENLAQRISPPTTSEEHSINTKIEVPPSTSESSNQSSNNGQLRKTSDLLDALQKALRSPPLENMPPFKSSIKTDNRSQPELSNQGSLTEFSLENTCKILLEIESALHLPRNPSKLVPKKSSRRSGVDSHKAKQAKFPPNEEPSAYVTFQAEEGYGNMIKSHEGMVYSTHVVEKSCNPMWDEKFEIAISADLLRNNEKRFILKVWKKAATNLAQCRIVPAPMEDSIIGFAAVDLNVFLARMPFISGWFNIVDFNGRINGQIKVSVKPSEDVMKFRKIPSSDTPQKTLTTNECTLSTTNYNDLNNSFLNRAIKRKFTELEEITQRLRARLFDVTGDPENEGENLRGFQEDEELDEFERDINTTVEDDDEAGNTEGRNNFGWLEANISKSNDEEKSSFDISISAGTSKESQERIQMISEFLRRTDLNENRPLSTSNNGVSHETVKVENITNITDEASRNTPEGRPSTGNID